MPEYPGSRGGQVEEVWASATPRYVLLHGGSWNPDPGSVVGDAHKNALFGRLIRARHVAATRPDRSAVA